MASLVSAIFVISVVAVSAAVYLLPTLIGWARHVPHIGSVAAINILLGWTLAGWAVALAMALRSASGPVVQVINQPFPPSAGPHPFPPAASRPLRPPPPAAPPQLLDWWPQPPQPGTGHDRPAS